MTRATSKICLLALLVLLLGRSRSTAQELQDVIISEILAANSSGLRDADGDTSDWIEFQNVGGVTVNLDGWFLSDDAEFLAKWRVPAVTIAPGGFLVVFASGKNRDDPTDELHTNFQLDRNGELLALVRPDGSLADALAPGFPRQHDDVSYGVESGVSVLVGSGSPAEFVAPRDGALGASWTASSFIPDAMWSAATLGIGFDVVEDDAPPLGLISWYRFDGDVADSIGVNDGVFGGGGPQFEPGHAEAPGGSLIFDGVDDIVSIPHRAGLPIHARPAYSVALWVRGPPQADKRVFSEGSSTNNSPVFNIGVDVTGATGRVDIFIRNAAGGVLLPHVQSSGIAFDGTWHHIVWTDAGGDAALFIDGVRDPVDFRYAKTAMALDRTSIGAILRAGTSFHFLGAIDEATLWDRVLPPDEIAALAAGGAPGAGLDRWIATDVSADLLDLGTSLFVRAPFTVDDPSALRSLSLAVRYDDGFVGFLNGREVARRNAPTSLAWNAAATTERTLEQAAAAEVIDLSAHLDVLTTGSNVLAVQVLNAAAADGDLLLAPELLGAAAPGETLRYFATPTPGAPNAGGFIDYVADTKFSVDRGYFRAPFELEISTATPEAVVRYTLDGTAPTSTSGSISTGPLRIASTTVVRAAAFRDGFEPSNVDTQTYLFVDDIAHQTRPPSYPTAWGGIAADYAMDPRVTDAAAVRPVLEDAFLALPTLSVVLDPADLFGPSGIYQNPAQTGDASERAASAELITVTGDIQADAGLRPMGNKSRNLSNTPKIGLRLVFKSVWGQKKLRFPLFPGSPVDEFDTLVLRSNYTDSWVESSASRRAGAQYVRDQWIRERQLEMGQPAVHGVFAHLFLNGLYWGIYNITERPDASFAAAHMGGDKDDWDAIKNHEEVVDGTRAAYDRLVALSSRDLRVEASYREVLELIDVDNLIDYMILNMYAPALDWPGNYYLVHERVPEGRFRFIAWDSDELFFEGLQVDRTGPHRRDADSPTKFYHALRVHPDFRRRFSERIQRHFFGGGVLTPVAVARSWRELAESLELALLCESARWGDSRRAAPYLPDAEWRATLEGLVDGFLPQRTGIVLDQFRCDVVWDGCEPLYVDAPPPVGGWQRPGDVNQDGRLDISDPARLLIALFVDPSTSLPCDGALDSPGNRALIDANGDGAEDLSDAVAALNFMFAGGPAHALGTECVWIEGCADRCR